MNKHHRTSPTVEDVGLVALVLEKASHFFSDATLRRMLGIVPLRRAQKLIELSDIIAQRSRDIIDQKKSAMREGDAVLVEQIGRGKDIMSICCEYALALHLSIDH